MSLASEMADLDVEELQAISSSPGYQEGDPDAVAAYYRVVFRPALKRPEDLEKLVGALRASFTRERILKGRSIEDRLSNETWLAPRYDLLPALGGLAIPTLVLRGDFEFVPAACAEHIAKAIPKARYVSLGECSHFCYLECPAEVHREARFFRGAGTR